MNILISGGAGFIGHRLIQELGQEHSIFVIDSLSQQVHGTKTNYTFPKNVTMFKSDIRSVLEEQLKGVKIDIFYHLAAETGTAQSMFDTRTYYDVNVTGFINQLDQLQKFCDLKRVVLASSRSIYGEGDYTCSQHGRKINMVRSPLDMKNGFFVPRCTICGSDMSLLGSNQLSSINPISQYAVTKYTQELLLVNFCRQHTINFNIFRLQNVYGAGQSIKNPYTGVLATFANLCIAGEGLNVYEDGQCARDFVHVKDVAKVLSNFNFLTANTDDSIDLGSGKPVRLIDVANFISKFLKCSATPIISGNFRVGDIRSNFSEVPISTYLNQTETDFWNEGLPEFLEFAGENFEQKNLELIELAKKESISANVLRSN